MDGAGPVQPEEGAEYDPFTECPDKELQAGLAGHMKREASPPPWAHAKRPRIQLSVPPVAPAMAAPMTPPAMAAAPMSTIYQGLPLQPQAMQGYGLSMPMAMPPQQVQYGPATMKPCYPMQEQAQGAPTACCHQQFAPTGLPGQHGCHAAPTNYKACPGPSCAPTVVAPKQEMARPHMQIGPMFHMPDAKQACLVAMKPKLLTPRPPKTPPPKSMPVEGHAPTAASESGSMPVKVETYEVHDSPEEHDQTYEDEEDWGKWRQSWSVRGASQKGQEWETHYSNDTKEEWQEDDWDDSWNYGYGYGTKECKNDEHEYGTNDQESKEWVTDSSYGHEKEWNANKGYKKGHGKEKGKNKLWNTQFNKGWEMMAAYLVEAYLAENWDRCSALCSKLLDMAHLLVEFGVFRLLFLQNNEKMFLVVSSNMFQALCNP